MTDLVLKQGREAQKCIFLAAKKPVAQDISDRVGALCDEVERLRDQRDAMIENVHGLAKAVNQYFNKRPKNE